MRVNTEDFTAAAWGVWTALSQKQRETIQADYPIKAARNSLIREFKRSGVEVQVLAEVSGLSRQSISTILNREITPDKASIEALKAELNIIQKAVGRLGAHIARLEQEYE